MFTVNHHGGSYAQTANDQIKVMGHVSEDVLYGLIDGHAAYETAYEETIHQIYKLEESMGVFKWYTKQEMLDELLRIRSKLKEILDMDFEN